LFFAVFKGYGLKRGFVGYRLYKKWVQRGKKAPDFSRGDELPLCIDNNTSYEKWNFFIQYL
jgi:hypothetical protein